MDNTLNNNKYFCRKCSGRNWLIECKCGCGGILILKSKDYKTRYFIKNHDKKSLDRTYMKGENHLKWDESVRKGKDLSRFNCTKCFDRNWLIECACGCGGILTRCGKNKDLKPREFIFNHHMNLDEFKVDKKGEKGNNWSGGEYFHKKDGYWYVKKHDHPNAQKDGYIRKHIYIFTEHHKCCMLKWGVVHHINEIKTDNNLDNLQGMMKKQHGVYHHSGKPKPKKNHGNRICLLCDSKTTLINKKEGHEIWYNYEGGFICMKCYKKTKRKG